MATILATLGLFRSATTDYSAGQARTLGSFHLVRKKYGDNAAIFNYARFTNENGTAQADFLAACANPDSADWKSFPYSEYDYSLLLIPLSSPLPASTSTSGALPAVTSGGSTDVTPVVTAIGASNVILANMLAGQSATGSRATETTQAANNVLLQAIASQLAGSLKVTATGTFFQAVQPISATALPLPAGAATEATLGKFLTSALTFNLPTGAATSAAQLIGNTSLASILAAMSTATGQADQLAKLETVRALLATTSTAALQTSGNQLLAGILSALGTLPPHASTDTLQAAGNTILGNILTVLGTGATAAGQQAQLADLDAIKATSALGATATLQTALNGLVATSVKQDTGNATLAGILQALGPAATANLQTAANTLLQAIAASTASSATAAKQDAGNTLLASLVQALGPAATAALQTAGNTLLQAIANSVAAGATAAGQTTLAGKQDTANGYLQALVQNGIATTAGPATPYSLVTLQGSNATTVRAGATWMLGGTVANTATAYRYLFLYNLAAAPANNAALPTTAAAGLVRTIAIPPNGSVSLNLPAGRYTAFSAGLTIAAAAGSTLSTVTSAAAGLTAGIGLTAGDLVINIDYAN